MPESDSELVEAEAEETAGEPLVRRSDQLGLGPLGDYIGFHLRLAQDASFRNFVRHTGRRDLRPGRFTALLLIRENPGITPMGLSRGAGRDKSTITPLLRDLERQGLIERRPVPTDRRSHVLALTPAGQTLLDELCEHAARHDAELDEIVGIENKPAFLAQLRAIIERLG
ncbi:MarR family winged helix-turn-helix transcriptional regulator [Propylenella binzhouense]|uniref:MarR family transcriptional regulator n=1 Tax=Propylenella binzhouense TaxID=2555902 RepID=A0A964WTZ9_9HYPH|nr:MarR family transcriptional regulator [Propylenella binzhouense]MYZ48531.1 MarR family transcriptional regulator [Propylenella binzhouense]